MKFNRISSMRKKLVLMFFGTTIIVHIIVGEISMGVIKTHFRNLGYNFISQTFNTVDRNISLSSYNPDAVEGFENTPMLIWNIKDNQISYQSSDVELPHTILNSIPQSEDEKYQHRWRQNRNSYLAITFYIDKTNSLVMGIPVNHQIHFLKSINSMMYWFTFVISLLAGLYSIVIVSNGLRPLKEFENYLKEIRPGNLSVRLPTKGLPSELKELSLVQNDMLDRLDDGFKRLSDFSSDIAHELRTPLTNMTTQTQVMLSSDRNLEEYRDTLCSNLEELERINKTINDTLYLAKSENDLLYQDNQQLNIHNEITQIVEYHNIVAEDKGLEINLKGQGSLYIDKHIFQRVINNLLSNAIRHASPNSSIDVILNESKEKLRISVINIGDTIPESSLPFIFDRFYRDDKSREYDNGFGAGLGLAIVKSIVETSGGTIRAKSSNGKTIFELNFQKNSNQTHQ